MLRRYILLFGLAILITGTAVGQTPELVMDIYPGATGSSGEYLTSFKGHVYFSADDGVSGSEVWRSDGTENGTFIYAHLFEGLTASRPHGFFVFNENLYFAGTHNIPSGFDIFLFRTDGNGTSEVVDEDAHPIVDFENPYLGIGDYLYLGANDITNGNVLYRVNATSGGAELVSTVNNPYNFAELNGQLLFSGNVLGNRELWHSDGTPAGTEVLAELNPSGDGNPYELTRFGDHVYFGATDGTGLELWRTDGTEQGTEVVKDIGAVPAIGSFPHDLTEYDGHLYFSAFGDEGSELWRTDGTEEGTELVADINPSGSSDPEQLIVFQNQLFFVATSDNLEQLWRSDGSQAGTVKVSDSVVQIRSLMEHNGLLYFVGKDSGDQFGFELWQSDGTSGGTEMVADINPGTEGIGESFDNAWLTSVGDDLFFIADDGTHGRELWALNTTSSSAEVPEKSSRVNLSIYPNPAVDYIRVSVESEIATHLSFELYDVQGRLVGTKQAFMSGTSDKIEIETRDLPSGVFFLRTQLIDAKVSDVSVISILK